MNEYPAEILGGLPVVVEDARARYIEPERDRAALGLVALQTATVVGAGVVAGAAAVALVHRRRARKLERRRRRVTAPVVASRSFLVDVHVLGERR